MPFKSLFFCVWDSSPTVLVSLFVVSGAHHFSHACSQCFRQLGSHSRNCQSERHYAAIPLNPHLTPTLHHPTHPSPIWWGQCLGWASGGGGGYDDHDDDDGAAAAGGCDGDVVAKKQDIYCISPPPYQPSARSKFCPIHILNTYINIQIYIYIYIMYYGVLKAYTPVIIKVARWVLPHASGSSPHD